MEKHQDAYESVVLPEVLKNPIAYYKTNKEESTHTKLQDLLMHLNKKPVLQLKNKSKKQTPQKVAKRVLPKVMDLSKKKVKK